MSDAPVVMRVEEVAELLEISRSSAYEAVRRGQIPSIRVGRRIRVPRRCPGRALFGADRGQNGHRRCR
jgi:excisionase family DNA binding protein